MRSLYKHNVYSYLCFLRKSGTDIKEMSRSMYSNVSICDKICPDHESVTV